MENESLTAFGAFIGGDWFSSLISNVFSAVIILVATFYVAGWVKRRIVAVAIKYDEIDDTLFSFLGAVMRILILGLGGLFVLNRFGVQTTSIIALLGAMGLAVGLALQGTLSNFAAGVMLVIFRPFKLGDFIEVAGQSGTVKQISMFTTEIATTDNVQIIIPNAAVWGSSIRNFSAYPTRRADLVFGVSYGSDLKKAEKIITNLITADSRIHADPAPFVKVTNLGDSSVDFTVRVWCDAEHLWNVKFDLTRAVKLGFDKGKIDIPFPTQTIVQG